MSNDQVLMCGYGCGNKAVTRFMYRDMPDNYHYACSSCALRMSKKWNDRWGDGAVVLKSL